MEKLDFITIEPKKILEDLIKIYEEETDTKLYPAQDAMILIKIMAYLATLLETKFNDAANLNLVRKSRFPILDFIAEAKECIRLENETDEDFIERILLAPEGYSVAGPELAYIYHTLSVDPDIVDVKLDCPSDDITVTYNEMVSIINEKSAESEINTNEFKISADYTKSEVVLKLNKNLTLGDVIKIKIPHPYELFLYLLTKSENKDPQLLEKVLEAIKPLRPASDCVHAQFANTQEFEIEGTIYIKKDAVEDIVKKSVNEVLNTFLDDFKNVLNKSVVRHQIIKLVCSIDGVYDFDLKKPSQNLPNKANINYQGVIKDLKYERVMNE